MPLARHHHWLFLSILVLFHFASGIQRVSAAPIAGSDPALPASTNCSTLHPDSIPHALPDTIGQSDFVPDANRELLDGKRETCKLSPDDSPTGSNPIPYSAPVAATIPLAVTSPAQLNSPDQSRAISEIAVSNATPDETAAIQRARLAVLKILREENGCSAWFRRTDPDVADTFASLVFSIERTGSTQVVREIGYRGTWIEHGPYVASTFQGTGRGTLIRINDSGAFFRVRGNLVKIEWAHSLPRETNLLRTIHAGPFDGGTLPAQAITLLHELAHVIGAIPIDGTSPRGLERSEENTGRVVRFCKGPAKEIAKQPLDQLLRQTQIAQNLNE